MVCSPASDVGRKADAEMAKQTVATGYVVLGSVNPALILCTDGAFHAKSMVGPGGYCAKVYKTAATAKRFHPNNPVQPVAL